MRAAEDGAGSAAPASTAVSEGAAASSGGSSSSNGPSPKQQQLELTVSLASGMDLVGKEEWDACATAGPELNPFLLHDFLLTLETSGSAVRDEGWLPQHMLVRGPDDELLGCCPMYLKGHRWVRGWGAGAGLLRLHRLPAGSGAACVT